jgi:hypothetical protein
VPFVVPNIPTFSLFTDLAAAAYRNVTPVQFGSISRIGSSIYATVPGGTVTLFTAWGFMAGKAPPGKTSLAVAASGLSMIRGNCYTAGGYARAYADIFVVVEEFEPVGAPEHAHSGLVDTHDSGIAEIAPDPTAVLGSIAFVRRVHSASTILINHETSVLGYQIAALDNHQDATVLVMPSRRETSIGGGSLRISIARLRSPDGAARTSRSTSTRCFSLSSRARILSRRGFGCFGPQKIPAGTEE